MAKIEFIVIDDPLKDGLKPSEETLAEFRKMRDEMYDKNTVFLINLNKAYEITKQSNTMEFGGVDVGNS